MRVSRNRSRKQVPNIKICVLKELTKHTQTLSNANKTIVLSFGTFSGSYAIESRHIIWRDDRKMSKKIMLHLMVLVKNRCFTANISAIMFVS